MSSKKWDPKQMFFNVKFVMSSLYQKQVWISTMITSTGNLPMLLQRHKKLSQSLGFSKPKNSIIKPHLIPIIVSTVICLFAVKSSYLITYLTVGWKNCQTKSVMRKDLNQMNGSQWINENSKSPLWYLPSRIWKWWICEAS